MNSYIENREEKESARFALDTALANGAGSARISLNMGVQNAFAVLDGKLDRLHMANDRSLYIQLYAKGRYGAFSTNRMEKGELEHFIKEAVAATVLLAEDPFRSLPDPSLYYKGEGADLGQFDPKFLETDSRTKKDIAFKVYEEIEGKSKKLISANSEYGDYLDYQYMIDSQGFEGRHTETSFSCFTEMTIVCPDGSKISGHWWEASPRLHSLDIDRCSSKALRRASDQTGPKPRRSGRYRMVVDTCVASRLVSPLFAALNASAIQQKMSFLSDSKGKQIFPEGMTIMDMGRTVGKPGSRLFDTEGIAVRDSAIIENGIVKQYFVNTYMANKTGMEPTVEDVSRPCLLPYIKGKDLSSEEKELSLNALLRLSGNGILVTGFNGGNCNPATGDFSFGIEGFAFRKGKITHPVREMLITGNMISLWQNMTAAGNDARECTRWQIPSLVFENVSFAG